MTTFVKLYVQGESSKMPVVYDRFGTNGLKESILASITFFCQEFSARPGKNNPVAGKEI
jgi:hypothetical protein